MVKILTDNGMIIFQDTVTGVTKSIGQNQLWVSFKNDTVNFLQLSIPTDGMDGTPFFSARASNLEINGQTYTIEQLKQGQGLSDLFTTMGWGYEIVDELPETGEMGVIYLVYDDETGTYAEYLWLSQEEVWEELGSVGDVELTNYYTKSEVNTILNGYAETSDLATVATTGSYDDLTDKPVIPTVPTNVSAFTNDAGYLTEHQSLSNYYNKSQTDNLLNGKVNIGSLATVANSGSYNDLTDKPDLSTKQDVLVSGVNIKTINSQSLLGEGNINIEGGGGGTQVQSNWNETDTTSMAYIQNKPTNVSSFVNDAGYLTQHQSLADVFADVAYDSATKRINFYGKGDSQHTTVLAYVDATDFVVDGMVSNVEVKSVTISGTPTTCLVITFNSDAGKQDINIPISQIFDASNYYNKTEVDTALSAKANSSSLATVATTGAYSDLTGTPTIPAAQVNSDWNAVSGVAQILNKPTIPDFDYYSETTTQSSKMGKIDTIENNVGAKVEVTGSGVDLNAVGSTALTELQIAETNINAQVRGGGYNTTSISVNGGYMEISFETDDYDSNGFRFGFDENGNMVIANSGGDNRVAMVSELSDKQDTLVSGTNIKTINNESILGSGNITISGGAGTVTGVKMNNGSAISPDSNGVVDLGTVVTTVDTTFSAQSNNPIANSTVYAAIGDIEAALQAINGTANA